MNLVWAVVIVTVVATLAVAVMFAVRRRAPKGGFFADGDRAAGVFGVLATGFAVLLGFVVFLAFQSYDTSRAGAEDEAVVLAQQVETAQLLPEEDRARLTGELICYGRSVAGVEWDEMEASQLDAEPNLWADELFRTITGIEAADDAQQSALDRWLDQRSEREQARNARIHGASGIIPAPLWIVLLFLSLVLFAYMLLFADSAELAVTQGVMMGTVAVLITTLLLLVAFLDDPYHDGVGGLQPVSMERALRTIDDIVVVLDLEVDPPCDAEGRPV